MVEKAKKVKKKKTSLSIGIYGSFCGDCFNGDTNVGYSFWVLYD